MDNIYEQLKGERGIGAGRTVGVFEPLPEGQRVLDIGFGQGELIRDLLNKGNKAYGMDVGQASFEGAITDKFIDLANLVWLDASHDRFPWIDNFFDAVFCLEAIEHLTTPAPMFLEAKRVLKPGGRFTLAFPRPEDNLGYNRGKHAHMYPGFLIKGSFRMFVRQMYFKILKYWENGSSAWYLLENVKDGDEVGIHEIIRGNYEEDVLFDKLKEGEWNADNDPPYIDKTLDKLGLTLP